jgi:hypothetical protein
VVLDHEILLNPGYQMVLESAFDYLVEKVGRYEFVYFRMRKAVSEGLNELVNRTIHRKNAIETHTITCDMIP